MNITVNIDWKFVAACGLGTMGVIAFLKLDPKQISETILKGIDAARK